MKLIHRDISWLSYNRRVMQEAEYKGNLAAERLKFLSIAINNLKTFVRERFFLHLNSENKIADELSKKISKQFSKCGEIFQDIKKELRSNKIFIPKISELDDKQWKYLSEWYRVKIKPHIHPVFLNGENDLIAIENEKINVLVQLVYHEEHGRALIEIPFSGEERFIEIPSHADEKIFIPVEDVLRHFLADIFPGHTIPNAHLFEMISGGEFYSQDEASEYLKDFNHHERKIIGSYFLFEEETPNADIKLLLNKTGGSKSACSNKNNRLLLNDCSALAKLLPESLHEKKLNAVVHPLEKKTSVLEAVSEKDELLYFPYHSFDLVIRLLREAAESSSVKNIFITLYRTAHPSKVIEQLEAAVSNGKNVFVFLEIKASENEEENILLAMDLEKTGVTVLRNFPEKKIHAKAILIEEENEGAIKRTALLNTGNFNEKSAMFYTDVALITSDKKITDDVSVFFRTLQHHTLKNFISEFVGFSPVNYREIVSAQIQNCIQSARENISSRIILKLNNLEDEKIIHELSEAADAGVLIEIIVRGICCMKPKENIRIISIVDDLLEHARIFSFRTGETENIFTSSADLMTRNLNKRIEFLLPIKNELQKKQLSEILQLQLRDNVKARLIDKKQKNKFVKAEEGVAQLRSQEVVREYFSLNKKS